MKFTVDLSDHQRVMDVEGWENTHYAVLQILREHFCNYTPSYRMGSLQINFSCNGEFDDKSILIFRLALGDDIGRLWNDAVRYLLNLSIDHDSVDVKKKSDINERLSRFLK